MEGISRDALTCGLLDRIKPEEEGVIGPADGCCPREALWQDDRDEAEYDAFEQDVQGGAVEG